MASSRISTGMLALLLGACTAGPDYTPPRPPSSPSLDTGKFLRGGETDAAVPAARWWAGLGDPLLSELIEKGVRQAPTIAAARARARQARAALARSRADRLPAGNLGAAYLGADLPSGALGGDTENIDLFNVGFDAQWELDLWGARGRGIEKAQAEAEAAGARLADAQVSLAAEIGRTYIMLRARQARLALMRERHTAQTLAAGLTRQRVERGTLAVQAGEAAEMQLRLTEAERATLGGEITALRDGLAVLTGSAPGALDGLLDAAVPLPPATVPIGDPAAMLARRPDVRAVERQLAAASAQIGIAHARRFPQVSLFGLIGIGGNSGGDLLDGSQVLAAGLPSLRWNFLDFGRNRAAVHNAEAGRDAALAEYDAAVLAALQDAEASLARFGAARTNFTQAAGAARSAERIAALENQRAKAGTIARGEALAAQGRAIDAQMNEVERRAGMTLAFVALVKALGLGWQDAAGDRGQ